MLTLELVVEQNTKMVERLDRSMAQLCQGMADLRVQMTKGQAELRQEIASVQTELRKEMAADHLELRKEVAASQLELRKEVAANQLEFRKEIAQSLAELHTFFERKFTWLISGYCTGLFTLLIFLAKYLLDSYSK